MLADLLPVVNEEVLARTMQRACERGIILPTFAQQRDPGLIPEAIRQRLRSVFIGLSGRGHSARGDEPRTVPVAARGPGRRPPPPLSAP